MSDESWFQKLNEHIDNEPSPHGEEIERTRTERAGINNMLEGTSKETAYMSEERAVTIKYWTYKDGVIGDGWELVSPTDHHYQEVCSRHHLQNPGDSNTITMKWINGVWQESTDRR